MGDDGETTVKYTSNLITNEGLALRFNQVAYGVARKLKSKYFSLFELMSEDDVVMECWSKILRQDISFKADQGCKFESFVYLMVNNRCIDLSRKIKKHEGNVSLNAPVGGADEYVTIESFVKDERGEDFIDETLLKNKLDVIANDMSCEGVTLYKILTLKGQGYNLKEIADICEVSSVKISDMLKAFKEVFKSHEVSQGASLEDILFSEDYFSSDRDKEVFINSLSYIKDTSSGINLSDCAKLILKDCSYSQIASELSVKSSEVKQFLERYMPMVF